MNTKICNKCNLYKPLSDFYDKKNICKKCKSEWSKKYYLINRCKILVNVNNYTNLNKEKINNKRKESYKNNIDNKIKINIRNNIYSKINKDKIIDNVKKWQNKNKEKIKKYKIKYYMKNKENIVLKRKNNIQYRIRKLIDSRIRKILLLLNKSKSTIELLGCSISELKNWLGIANYYDSKKYHIDHIIPCSLYDLTIKENQLKCFNYRNLRLIPAKENLYKSDKLDVELIKAYQIEDLLPENLEKWSIK